MTHSYISNVLIRTLIAVPCVSPNACLIRPRSKMEKTRKSAGQREQKLREFLAVETTYLDSLETILVVLRDLEQSREDAGHPVPMPDPLRDGRDKIVIGNFPKLRDFHRNVLSVGIRENLHSPTQLR